MGLFDDEDDELFDLLDTVKKYPSCIAELNEGIVQEIFNRCLANKNTKEPAIATLFPTALGYKSGSEKLIQFDKDILLKNKKSIEFLFGQLHKIHNPDGVFQMSIDDFNTTYQNKHWSTDKATLLKLLYLGVSSKTHFISSFTAETSTSMISPRIKPTLSPKDPNFPAWWEEHKAEWEEKKDDQEENNAKRLER